MGHRESCPSTPAWNPAADLVGAPSAPPAAPNWSRRHRDRGDRTWRRPARRRCPYQTLPGSSWMRFCHAGRRRKVPRRNTPAVVTGQKGRGDGRVLVRPVQAGARQQPGFAVVETGVHAIAVVLDLVQPLRTLRRLAYQFAKLWFDPLWQTARNSGYRSPSARRRRRSIARWCGRSWGLSKWSI